MHRGAAGVVEFETAADGAQAQARCGRDLLRGGARAVVAHGQAQHALLAVVAALDAQQAGPAVRIEGVLDAVLDQRLEAQCRQQAVADVRVEVPFDPQALAKAQAFQLQIVAHEVEFGVERDPVDFRAFGVEHIAQHVRELE